MNVKEIYTLLTSNQTRSISIFELANEMKKADDLDDMTRNCLDLLDYTVTIDVLRKVSEGKKIYAYYPMFETKYPRNYAYLCEIADGSLLIEK
ncbi:MAG: hypothetical protein IKO90_02910 [Bacteroidales bacterium]|nr:hypothetical protein [Bacteroidales bacterium]